MMPVKRKKVFRRKAVAAGVALALGAAGVGSKIGMRRAAEKRQAMEAKISLAESRGVRNPGAWGKICSIYDWNPRTKEGMARIKLIEKVSVKTGVPSERVMATIETNALEASTVKSWRNRLNSLERELRDAERVVGTGGKGHQGRMAKSKLKTLPVKIGQAERVMSVIESLLAENPGLAAEIQKEVKAMPGTLSRVKEIK